MCTDVAIMEAGRLLAAGAPATILDQLGAGRHDRGAASPAARSELHRRRRRRAGGPAARRLLDEGLPVVEFRQDGGGLEDLFLAITKGVVQ